ncbi:MAG: hypothetical protein K9K30_04330 [Burkholderiaceae bacterium]|nr:hypothetical protein [Sulfuritalea sp.]MCF8174449.1 hypothetical protein [Burkholderiaceae bacterium]
MYVNLPHSDEFAGKIAVARTNVQATALPVLNSFAGVTPAGEWVPPTCPINKSPPSRDAGRSACRPMADMSIPFSSALEQIIILHSRLANRHLIG